jgi:5-methylcytosine-specific restriction protein B
MLDKMGSRQLKHQLKGGEQLLSESDPGILEVHNEDTKFDLSSSISLNTIFFGPPGTGKTYKTILRAAEIVENRTIAKYEDAIEIFNSKLNDQIEFITFHQNYSYEDFIQGLRPDTDNENGLLFEKRDGVFKKIADRALTNLLDSEKTSVVKKPFDETFNEFIKPLSEGETEEIEVKMKLVSFHITSITKRSIEFRKKSGDTSHTLSIETLRRMYDAGSIIEIQGLAPYYTPLLEKLLKIGFDSTGKKEVVTKKNYVIVIDEINRANISRVFGELITLIEKDKRSHGEFPMKVTLPSGDKFIVPSNLYIIGTMNTADKSIALLDIALRRRFEFEPMYPLYEIQDVQIYDVDILKGINDQIIKSKGRDFQIGHSFFMGENKDLVKRMNNKVIPLLLEYYMNDEKEVNGILQTAGLVIDEDAWPIRITGRK